MIVITDGKTFGPFESAALNEEGDALVCDGVVLPLAVIGNDYEISDDDSQAPPPAPPVPQVPLELTRRKGLAQLRWSGITEDDVVLKINQIVPEGIHRDLALIEFKESQVFERYRPLTILLGAAFGLDLDHMFIEGDKR